MGTYFCASPKCTQPRFCRDPVVNLVAKALWEFENGAAAFEKTDQRTAQAALAPVILVLHLNTLLNI